MIKSRWRWPCRVRDRAIKGDAKIIPVHAAIGEDIMIVRQYIPEGFQVPLVICFV